MSIFKRDKKEEYRIVGACGGFVPQHYTSFREWTGISKSMETWLNPENQQKYCVCETEKTAQIILDSYKAITQ